MNSIFPYQGAAPITLPRTGPVTREQVHTRTRELAGIAGRGPLEVSQNDYDQARSELTGESDGERQEAVLDGIFAPPQPT
jgi:hypothetical protein